MVALDRGGGQNYPTQDKMRKETAKYDKEGGGGGTSSPREKEGKGAHRAAAVWPPRFPVFGMHVFWFLQRYGTGRSDKHPRV